MGRGRCGYRSPGGCTMANEPDTRPHGPTGWPVRPAEVVSDPDFCPPGGSANANRPGRLGIPIREVVTATVAVIGPNVTLRAAAEHMKRCGTAFLLVSDVAQFCGGTHRPERDRPASRGKGGHRTSTGRDDSGGRCLLRGPGRVRGGPADAGARGPGSSFSTGLFGPLESSPSRIWPGVAGTMP